MEFLYPRFTFRQFLWMLLFGAVGSMIAGIYGVIHDQVTYTLGPEYFTCFKFDQFFYLDPSQPTRVLVGEIGFLATWWVGMFSGWFLGRLTIPHEPLPVAARHSLVGVMIIVAMALLFGAIASTLPVADINDPSMDGWRQTLEGMPVTDPSAFLRVGNIHNASYFGGLVGLITALIWVRRRRTSSTDQPSIKTSTC